MKTRGILTVLLFLFLCTGITFGGEPSLRFGKQLFSDPTLAGSGNASSCNTCHAEGKGLLQIAEGVEMAAKINRCVEGQMAGQKIDDDSATMSSLRSYVKSLTRSEW